MLCVASAQAQAPAQGPGAGAAPPPVAFPNASAPAPMTGGVIKSISVVGNQRLEADTVRSYIKLKAGDAYTRESLDQALKDLYATELFADVSINQATDDIVITVRENPVINRIVLEGNKRLKEDKIRPEIKLAPRQIFTRSKVRADVARIIELYRRQGRFAATVEPKMVQLDQNRVDVVFEISEGAKSKVRRINIIGNEKFSDGRLRGEMATKESSITHIFSSGTSYDPDRLAYDQQKMRQFYLTEGYADFRVVSAVAELTPDKKDFIITYVVEEGERYKFGDVKIESDIRDLRPEMLQYLIRMKKDDWYNAKMIEDTVDQMTETAGLLGYAFADVSPDFRRDKDKLQMNVTFKVADAPRVYVERININGNTVTRDKVIRREFRLGEGDAFNGFQVKRSRDRIRSLGYFQDKLEIEQKQGSAPDRVVLEANVEEKATGELQVSAGFSSLERFIVNLSVTQRNFMGKGQELRASVDYSTYSKSIELGFTEPYLFDRNIAVGGDVFRRDYNSFNYLNDDRQTTYHQVSTGFQIRSGVPLTEYTQLALRYGLTFDNVTLDKGTFYTNGVCDPLLAGRYLCDAVGNRLTSSVGYSFVFDNLNNRLRPSAGQRVVFSQDVAGLGGDVKYLRSRLEGTKYWNVFGGFIFSVGGEGGAILPFQKGRNGSDAVRLTDRFMLGSPQMRGFDIRGIGPRVKRTPYDTSTDDPNDLVTDKNQIQDDAIGGRYYYHARAELEIPLSAGAREMGLRPSIYVDAGALWGVKKPSYADGTLIDQKQVVVRDILDKNGNLQCLDGNGLISGTVPVGSVCPNGTTKYTNTINPFREEFLGDSPRPRIAVGFGVNWNSPFGPLRLDIAKALVTVKGDDPKLFTFNVGTQF
ncbi:outer membrane protein assembly factor BamA [Sphingomonas sp. XMGL2]|uniref:Outer membrane protein assembly factor BamA n=1 Tax=Sphingomonas quercus TaxID=2842451 RepID=A0ABS6BEK5_9SPHN|nr:outer membrane protein assembly factor BamA [Sphingomonas quercus]MBU3076272.1 outer membrane protein assembly factor BamA [Sphingomonas quercus]